MTNEPDISDLAEAINDASLKLDEAVAILLRAVGEASLLDAPEAHAAFAMLQQHVHTIRAIQDEHSEWLFPDGPNGPGALVLDLKSGQSEGDK